MTTKQDLGTMEKVALSEVWEYEVANFTPWLSENTDLLGDALGLDLEAVEQEASVGTFSLDILAQESGTERAATEFARTRRRMVELAAAGIPDCRAHWIADTIHDIGYHKPGELAAAIGEFLG